MTNYAMNDSRAEKFKALSNPYRLILFSRLMTCCESNDPRFCIGQLGEGLDIAPSTLSHHLKELNRAGLVNMKRRGKNVECWVEQKVMSELASFFRPL